MKRILSCLLIVVLFLSACGEKPPVSTTKNPAATTKATETVPQTTQASWRQEARGLAEEPMELPEWPYNSPAVDFSPTEGIRITAEAGALYDDTEITLAPLGEDRTDLLPLAADFEAFGEPLIGAWEVHAGLAEEEHLPGEYTVSIDLSTLDLDESLYGAVRLYRYTEEGSLTAYNTTLEGAILSYSTDQNSITFASIATCVVVGLALGIPVYYGIEKIKADWYYWDGTGASYHHGKTKYGDYMVKWSMKDVDPKQQEKMQQMLAYAEKYKPQAQADYAEEAKIREGTGVFYRMFNENMSVEKRIKEYLEKDKDFQKLAQSLKVPELIEAVIEAVERAYNYLGGTMYARMPKGELTFRLKRTDGSEKEDTYGNSVATMLSKSYIEINVDKIIGILKGDAQAAVDRDNMLLTITHELFHICQERYHTRYLTDSIRFDEMTALVLEADAKQWYKDEGFITTDPPLTQTNYWGTLRLPIDESLLLKKLVMRHQGYLLSEFIFYLREKTGLNPDAVDIYRCRSYWKKPTTSEPLMAAFKLSEVTFDKLFRKFCVDHRTDFTANYGEDFAREEYNHYPQLNLEKDKGVHVALATDGSYSAGIRCFNMYDTGILPLLMVMDENLAAEHPEANLVPGEKYISTRSGAYLPGPEKWVGGSQNKRLFLEVYGKLGAAAGTTSGYTVWAMDAPEAPKLACVDGSLIVTLPEPTGVAKAGLMDGIILKIVSDDGKVTEQECSKHLLVQSITIPLRELLQDGTEKATLTVSLAEFVYSTKDKALPGRYSKEVSIPVDYAVKGQAYQFNSSTMVNMTAELAHPALRDAFEHSTLYLSDDGSITIKGSGRAARAPEDAFTEVEGSATAQFSITGKWDAKSGTGTATISGSVTHKEKTTSVKESKEVAHVTDRDGRALTLTYINRIHAEELTDFTYHFSGSGTVKAVNKELYKGVEGLILSLGSDWTREGEWEVWRWTSYDHSGDPQMELHEVTEKTLINEDRKKDPWEEGWQLCWTIGQADPVLRVGSTVMPFTPGGN